MGAQSALIDGRGNIIVQAQGEDIRVQIGHFPHLRLIPVERRVRRQPKREIDILNPAFQSVPLVGRDEDLDFLRTWLATETAIAVTALVGPGGSGKTRLALEFLQQLPSEWQGGFLTAEEAARFLGQENVSEWSWQKPTFIVVDYAGLMTGALKPWFMQLADHSQPAHPLRILLLERHADSETGWFHDLADDTWHGSTVRELFSPLQPRRISPLEKIAQRCQVLDAGLKATASVSQPPRTIPPLLSRPE